MRIPKSLFEHASAIDAQRTAAGHQPPKNGKEFTLHRVSVFVVDPFTQTVEVRQIAASPEGLMDALGYRDPVHQASLGLSGNVNLSIACRQHLESLAILYADGRLPPAWQIRGCNVPLMDKAVIYARKPDGGVTSVAAHPDQIRELITWA